MRIVGESHSDNMNWNVDATSESQQSREIHELSDSSIKDRVGVNLPNMEINTSFQLQGSHHFNIPNGIRRSNMDSVSIFSTSNFTYVQ